MKKIAGLLAAFVAVFSLTACGSTSNTFKCTGKIEGEDATVTGTIKGGKVTKIVAEQKKELESEEQAKQGAAMYNGFGSMAAESGMSMTAKASGKTVTISIEVDVEKFVKAAKDNGEDTDDNAFGIDLSKTNKDEIVKAFEEQGLTCE